MANFPATRFSYRILEGTALNPEAIGNALLCACVAPAMYSREKRLWIEFEGGVCPVLSENIEAYQRVLRSWYHDMELVRIECSMKAPLVCDGRGSGVMLSGGLDSLNTLRRATAQLDPEGATRTTHGIFVEGFDIGGFLSDRNARFGDVPAEDPELADRALSAVRRIASSAGVDFVHMQTNIRDLFPYEERGNFWMKRWHGAALVSAVRLLSETIQGVRIASTYDVPHLAPWGSHPMLDQFMSSSLLTVVHDGVHLSRLEKARSVSDWDEGLRNLRVCTKGGTPTHLNCGRCEKCMRTMLAFQALGVQSHEPAFEKQRVELTVLRRLALNNPYQASCWETLIAPLESRGELALASCVRRILRRYRIIAAPGSPIKVLRDRVKSTPLVRNGLVRLLREHKRLGRKAKIQSE